jgi:hypothetical protein
MLQESANQDRNRSGDNLGAEQGQDAYRRDGVHLGEASASESPGKKGGGGTGYDVEREQNEVNREQEEMHKERDPDQLEIERTQTPQPEINPEKENPGTEPTPEIRPGSSTMGSYNRGVRGGWSQSSWDANSFR